MIVNYLLHAPANKIFCLLILRLLLADWNVLGNKLAKR